VGARVRVAIRAGDILLATQKPVGLSARNVLEGTIDSIETRGSTVVCRVSAGAMFVVHVTPRALRSLEISVGMRVLAGDQNTLLPARGRVAETTRSSDGWR